MSPVSSGVDGVSDAVLFGVFGVSDLQPVSARENSTETASSNAINFFILGVLLFIFTGSRL